MKKLLLVCSFVLVLVIVLVITLRKSSTGSGTSSSPISSTITSTSTSTKENAKAGCDVSVLVVDLAGKPLENIIPIAAEHPNAFEPPVVQGPPTDAAGKSAFVIPAGRQLFIRGWDPTLMMFSNNYLGVTPEPGTQTGELKITMVHGASLDAVLLLPDKTPAANMDVALMLVHPTEGPWWPDKAQTDANGAVHFPSVAPGQFTIKLKVANAGTAEAPDVILPPLGHASLGSVVLSN